MTAAAPPPLPAVIGGKYRPLRLIARGGMGAVYEVVHANTGEHLALKLMLARSLLAPDLVERFRREARIQSSVKSEHVVRVVDADVAPEIDGAPFLVMELLAGKDFERICAERQPTPAEVVDWLRQVAQALDKAHKERIIHRDLKPENLFLAEREDQPPIVKILDFGVAKLITEGDDGSTMTGQILGTPRYMAPEQAAGAKKISPAADRFALGLIAFRLLSGRHYFDGDNWVALLQTVTRGPAARPSEVGCDRGPAFDAWFARACALDPMQRFGTCAEQVDALAGALKGASFKWRRKLWPPSRAMGVIALVGAVACGAIVWRVGRGRGQAPPAGVGTEGGAQTSLVLPANTGDASAETKTASDVPIPITGIPADWTNTSRVLATVGEPIDCLVALPDRRSLRFVWGFPRHAVDVDIRTGERKASRLVPVAYAEDCPDLSPDGRELIFQGYSKEKRPVIFRSKPDGSDARVAVTGTSPNKRSGPRWLGNGAAFAFWLDDQHSAVADRATDRVTVLPNPRGSISQQGGGWFAGRRHVVTAGLMVGSASILELFSWPGLTPEGRFSVESHMEDIQMAHSGQHFYFSSGIGELVRIEPGIRSAQRMAAIKGQAISFLAEAAQGIAFVSRRDVSNAWVRQGALEPLRLTDDGETIEISRCGPAEFLVSKGEFHDRRRIVRMKLGKRSPETLVSGWVASPVCSKTAGDWWFSRVNDKEQGLYRCRQDKCDKIYDGFVQGAALSPDEGRIAFVTMSNRGFHVRWVPSEGGDSREVANTETNCAPGWTSNQTLWVSRRRGRGLEWTEVEADSARETGKVTPGARDCRDWQPDPSSPVNRDARIVVETTSQVRFIALEAPVDALSTGALPSSSPPAAPDTSSNYPARRRARTAMGGGTKPGPVGAAPTQDSRPDSAKDRIWEEP